ncbi:MAG: sigma-54-dependent Fis family transcriptional regulator, partial [Gemmatimonadetes bacterium]|nr:sigma-54-dependent Fis family transcriptional regulator [Gemmatimonadota bacterium]
QVPPLRERRGDISVLVEHFRAELTRAAGVGAKRFSADAVQALSARDWPGNVRELKNAVERLLILAPADSVSAGDVAALVGGPSESPLATLLQASTFEGFKEEAERAFLVAKLAENGWNVSETARKLEMPRSNLYKKIERYGLQREAAPESST